MTTSTQQLDAMIERVRAAQAVFARYDQGQVDAIFHHAAAAATSKRIALAKMAVEETGMGILGGQGDQESLCLGIRLQ